MTASPSAVPPTAPGQQRGADRVTQPPASLTEQLAQQLQRPVDDAARTRASALVVDWLGCALGALRSPLAAQLRGVVQAQAGGNATALTMGLAQMGQFLAIERTSVTVVAVLGATEPFFAMLLASWVLHTEPAPSPRLLAGAALSLLGVMLVGLS